MVKTITFFDLHLDRRGPDQLRDDILADLKAGRRIRHISLNAIKLVAARKDPLLWRALQECDCLSADGMGIVWAAKMLGYPLAGRVTGIDLMINLMPGLARAGHSVFLLGARPDIVARTARQLTRDYPGLNIVGFCDGYGKSDGEMAARVRQSGADVVFVALPSPRKECFVTDYADAFGARLLIGVGGAFDVISGAVKRAPLGWQRAGLEWFWRVLQAPRSMTGRYMRGLGQFGFLVVRRWCAMQFAAKWPMARGRPSGRRLVSIVTLIMLIGSIFGAGTALGQSPNVTTHFAQQPSLPVAQIAVINRNGAALADALAELEHDENRADSLNPNDNSLTADAAVVVAGFLEGLVNVTHPGLLPAMDGATLTSVLAAFFARQPDDTQNAATGNDAPSVKGALSGSSPVLRRILSTLEQVFASLLVQKFIPATLMGGIQGLLANALLVAILRYGDGGGDPARLAYHYAPGLSAAAFGNVGDGFDRYMPVVPETNRPAAPAILARPGVVAQVFAAPEPGDRDMPAPFDPEKPVVQNPDGNDDWWPDDASPR
ncbi:WecB/TagA/CpsF family glycosyltransferase [Thalassospira sp. TSL5-1]|uniref:WecB/TagA/CpsF family glycosyltransferase n=1 Tax=Thalassospira sp. TSL5-1 TaxID=1544451 RepID=UPI00143A29F7|nr:WecB/TagA/CpsF family glycosyltransferase [Thalassospira sp. TSL5-1]